MLGRSILAIKALSLLREQCKIDQIIHVNVITALFPVGMENRRTIIIEFPDHVTDQRRLFPQAINVRTIDIGKPQAGHTHSIGIAKRLCESLRCIFRIRINQRGKRESFFFRRKVLLVLIHRIRAGLDDFLRAISASVFQYIHQTDDINGNRLLWIFLAIRQGRNPRNIVDIINVPCTHERRDPILVPHVHDDQVAREIMIVEFQIIIIPIREIVDENEFRTIFPKTVRQLRTDKACCSRNQNFHDITPSCLNTWLHTYASRGFSRISLVTNASAFTKYFQRILRLKQPKLHNFRLETWSSSRHTIGKK